MSKEIAKYYLFALLSIDQKSSRNIRLEFLNETKVRVYFSLRRGWPELSNEVPVIIIGKIVGLSLHINYIIFTKCSFYLL